MGGPRGRVAVVVVVVKVVVEVVLVCDGGRDSTLGSVYGSCGALVVVLLYRHEAPLLQSSFTGDLLNRASLKWGPRGGSLMVHF